MTYLAGQKLRASDLQRLATPPLCILRRVAAQSIASGGAGTNIFFDTEDYDSDTLFAPTSDTVTIVTAGKYVATLTGTLAGSGQFFSINHNGFTRAQANLATCDLKTPAFGAAVADTIKCGVFQSSGIAQNLTAAIFSVWRVSD